MALLDYEGVSDEPGIEVSIDRLTIVADGSLNLFPGIEPKMHGVKLNSDGRSFNIEIAISENGETHVENIAFVNFYDFGTEKSGIRVDFNPNRRNSINSDDLAWKSLDDILTFLVGKKRLSRIDIAFDVHDDRMRNYRYFKANMSDRMVARDKRLQTAYYGSAGSDRRIRQYDKQAEQMRGKNGVRVDAWWRLELQLRTKKIDTAADEIREMLSYFKMQDWSHVTNLSDRMMLIALDQQPELYAELSKQKKSVVNKYRKTSPASELADELLDIYEKSKLNLKDELARYILQNNVEF